jgi:hypothetical protein
MTREREREEKRGPTERLHHHNRRREDTNTRTGLTDRLTNWSFDSSSNIKADPG